MDLLKCHFNYKNGISKTSVRLVGWLPGHFFVYHVLVRHFLVPNSLSGHVLEWTFPRLDTSSSDHFLV